MNGNGIDVLNLPQEIREKLAELDLELSEGDITQKGYEKKRAQLLAPFARTQRDAVDASPGSRAVQRHHRRLTRDESRYHSEVRVEAVQAALAEYAEGRRERPSMLQPQRRRTRTAQSSERRLPPPHPSRSATVAPSRTAHASDSSSDDESLTAGASANGSTERGRQSRSSRPAASLPPHPSGNANERLRAAPPDIASCVEVLMKKAQEQQRRQLEREADAEAHRGDSRRPNSNFPPIPTQTPIPDEQTDLGSGDVVYANTQPTSIEEAASQDYQNAVIPLRPIRVSLRIQQLLNSLQRPRQKPLQDFYNDDDAELEALAKMVDPSSPRAEGATMTPERGEGVSGGTGQARSLDSALHKHATNNPKAVAAMVLDIQAKPCQQILYAKLLSRANKVAYMLLTRTVAAGKEQTKTHLCKPGDRVALIFPNTEPLSFLCAFYGCILAGAVPVPVEVPITKRDAGIQQLGFLLGSCGVRVALTSEACYKGLPKTSNPPGSLPSVGLQPSGSTSLSGSSNEVVDLKGWPKLFWLTIDSMSKPPRDWSAGLRVADESVAYIEYTTDREGAMKGVCVSREALLAHARSLATAMNYQAEETMVCVVDPKREVGLWHAVITAIFCGMRVIFVPYSLMKMNPTSWLIAATQRQATVCVAKSRDLHWALMAQRNDKEINLNSIRSIVVADGGNPWSLSSCDLFSSTFASLGLRTDAMCPCAGSSETGTISIRRRATGDGCKSGRGILSMSALSHSVVRVDKENSLTSLTLQDAGQVVPGAVLAVVKQSGPPRLCRADEVGEVCLCAASTASAYWALDGVSAATFRVEPIASDGRPLGPLPFVRSGLLGFMGPDGLVFVVGRRSCQLSVSGRVHSADDLIATVLAVEPMRFVYRGRIAIFSQNVLRDERIVIVAEQKPRISEEAAFEWMSNVLQAVDSIHQVGVYCLALVPVDHLPKTPLGGIHVAETRSRFVSGSLHPTTLLLCPHACVLNLPKPRERQQADVGPAAIFVGNIVQGVRIAGAQGRALPPGENEQVSLLDLLRQRAAATPDHQLHSVVTSKGTAPNIQETETATCSQLLRKAERIAALISERGRLNAGDHVALIFPAGVDMVASFYGCLVAGVIPVCIRPPSSSALSATLPGVRLMVDVSKAVAILSTSSIIKLLKSKEALHRVDSKSWPLMLDADDLPSSSGSKKRTNAEVPERKPSDICYVDFSVSTTGQLAGVRVSFAAALSLCKSLKLSCELYASRSVIVCVDPYAGLGLSLWALAGVYAGHLTLLVPPTELEASPSVWIHAVSTVKVRDAFVSYALLEKCVKDVSSQVPSLLERGISLSSLRACTVVAEERARGSLVSAFCRLFAPLGLSSRAVSSSFGCRVNAAICMQGAAGPEASTVYVDSRALRNDRVSLVGKGAPHSIQLVESGTLMPGVKVVIADVETHGQCADSHLGEIWVASPHNSTGYFTVFGGETSLHTDHFNAFLATGDTRSRFARTGYLGFIRQTQSITEEGELHEAVFVVGSMEEALHLRGMTYHPVDIEASIARCHRLVGECAVFTWSNLLVSVVECIGPEQEALDLVPAVTSVVLEEQHLIVGVVVIVDPSTVVKNCRGEKQRTLLRDSFVRDQLDPIYVAYNM